MKQTLRAIKQTTNVTTKALAERAQLPMGDVFTVEVGGFVSREKALKVLTAFNQLSGRHITLDDIQLFNSQVGNNRLNGF